MKTPCNHQNSTGFISNKKRIELIYQATLELELQKMRNQIESPDSLLVALQLLDLVEKTVAEKYPEEKIKQIKERI